MNKWLLLPILLMISISSLAATSLSKYENHSWMIANYHDVHHVLSGNENIYINPIINTLTDIWLLRDGSVSGEVSPLLVSALINHSDATLVHLSDHPESFNRWLNELEGLVFTDHTGEQSKKLEVIRVQLISTMKSYAKNGSPDLVKYALQLIERVESISIRTVD